MKVSLPGLGGIKTLALAHGEKLVIAIVVACVGYMVFKSLGRESLPADREASDLQQAISAASSEINEVTWDSAVKDHAKDVRLVQPLEKLGGNVDSTKYVGEHSDIGMNPRIVPPIVRRSDPVLLAVADVEASGGSGLLAFTNDKIRQERVLAAQRKAAQQAADQQKKQDQNRGAATEEGRNPRNRNARTEDQNQPVDPAHPKRRPANPGMRGSVGVQQVGDEEVKVAYWAVVVAKVPVKEQYKLFEDALSRSLGYSPQADLPQYLGYIVQRAEARPGVEDKDLKWQEVVVSNGKGQTVGRPGVVTIKTIYGSGEATAPTATAQPSAITDWASSSPEVVDPRYLDPNRMLAYPLPPLIGRNWGRDVTHPDVPLIEDAVEIAAEAPAGAAADAPANAEDEDMFGGAAPGAVGGGGRPGAYGGEMGRGGGGRFGGGGEFGPGGGVMGRGGMDMRGGGGAGMYGGGGGGGMNAEGVPIVPNWLLRFFDFSVQPGKKYKYRVQLVLLDPNQTYGNHLVSIDWLDKVATDRVRADRVARKGVPARVPYRTTEWSAPSRVVSIPLAGNVHVVSAKPAAEQIFTDEPKVSLLVESFSADDTGKPVEGAKQDDFRRGYVANQKTEAEALVIDDEGRQMIDKLKDFQLRTGITVVDIRGGDRLAGRDNLRPARVLLMDPAGQLFVQSEMDDVEAVKMHEAVFSNDPEAQRGMGGRGGMDMGRGGEMGGEFGGRGGPYGGR